MKDINHISSTLYLSNNGIWHANESSKIHYPNDAHESLYSIEDNSFWFQHRNKCITTLVKAYPPKDNGYVFDIGGGNGLVSSALLKNGFNVVLVEPGIQGILNARQRGLTNLVCASFEKANFNDKSLPAIGLFDVLEHVEDDLGFLTLLKSSLIDQGRLYITVPAYQFLWSKEDIDAGHFRRYTLKTLSTLLEKIGFTLDHATYIFRPLPLPLFLTRTLPHRLKLSNAKSTQLNNAHQIRFKSINKIIHRLLESELPNIQNKKTMNSGGSCLISATKV